MIKRNGKTVGAVGVVGPRRMDYAKVLATLESIGGNIVNIIDDDSDRFDEKKRDDF